MGKATKKIKMKNGEIQFQWLNYNQKEADLDEDEQLMRQENLKSRGHISTKGVQNLMAGVCMQAVSDYKRYRKALAYYADDILHMKNGDRFVSTERRNKIEALQAEIRECEEFFHSEIFGECSGIWDGKLVIEAINRIPKSYDNYISERR